MKIKCMLKKTLSVLLAGAMSLTVFTACDDKKDNDKDTSSVKEMLLDVFETAANSTSLSGVFSGNANAASKTDMSIEFGKGITDALGTEVKPLSLTSETKLKDSKAGTDISVFYGGNSLISLNGIYDNDSKEMYIKVPELSDAYLSLSSKDLDGLKDDIISSGKAISGIKNPAVFNIKKLVELKVTDYENLLKDYIKTVADSLPKAGKEEDYSGSLSDVEYNYKLKTYTITYNDAKNIIERVFEKLKNDEKIKELAVGILGSILEITDDSYAAKIDELKENCVKELSSDLNEEISLIFDGDNLVGIKDNATLMCIDRKDAYVLSLESETANYLFKATETDGKINLICNAEIPAVNEDAQDFSLELKAEDLEVTDKDNGFISGDADIAIQAGNNNIKIEMGSKAEEKNLSSELKLNVNDVEYIKLTSTSEITSSSDISDPSGTIYTLSQIEDYQTSMKLDELTANFKKVLGDDLTSALSSIFSSKGGDDDSDISSDDVSVNEDDEKGAIMLEDYYNEDGSFNYDKLKEDLGEEDYKAFMSQIDLDDFKVDADDIEF